MRILGESYNSLIEDCVAVLGASGSRDVQEEVRFALDGVGAMRSGHYRSAQAMFTVILDTLVSRFYPDKKIRSQITNHAKGAEVPGSIDEMGFRDALVWLPVWNAHEEYYKRNGDKVPRCYSRHASVHAASSRQFGKRNCVQVLMLVASLIGYGATLEKEGNS